MNRSAHYTPFLAKAIRDLDVGINSHARWLSAFHQAVICGSRQLEEVTSVEAHRLCGFGRWFHDGLDVEEWAEWKADLENIDALHRAVHAGARGMMSENRKIGQAACAELYEAFAESAMRLELALRALQNKLVDTVCLVDPLTGVWNRSSMQQRLGEEYSRMQRCGQPSALCMMDLDHFKSVNDNFGHVVGDKVLQSATEVAKKRLRTYDSIFRYGGEEFLFCLPNISADVATTAMDRIRADLEESAVSISDGREIRVTASFGVTPFLPDLSLEENIETADRALFCAKTEGRNRVCLWH
jgi:diguanylate cyclase (GGDEF)-like protein